MTLKHFELTVTTLIVSILCFCVFMAGAELKQTCSFLLLSYQTYYNGKEKAQQDLFTKRKKRRISLINKQNTFFFMTHTVKKHNSAK